MNTEGEKKLQALRIFLYFDENRKNAQQGVD